MYLAAFVAIVIFGVGFVVTMRFALRLLWHMLDLNYRAHQEIAQLAAQRRRR